MDKLQIQAIFEILGRPPEHITEALNLLIERLGAEKGVKVIQKQMHEPIEVKDSKDLYTSFADVSLELDSVINYFNVLFAYMPAHTEMIYPEKISFSNSELNEFANQLVLRLHNYDAITKNVLVERDIILKKLQEVAPHLFKQPPADEPTQKVSKVKKKSSSNKVKKNKKQII